jgi:hypothetical protein|tara:strand:+ start:6943 stop:7113 length:171 start_codon:yes stop_codon:yes gene_type:complete
MNPLIFLGAAALVFFLGTFIIWIFQREKKTNYNSSIEEFQAGLEAIAPDNRRKRTE